MTVTPLPPRGEAAPVFDLEKVLAGIDTMAAQRPVAAQIVSVANSDDTSAKVLSRILASDVALAGRVMKLANSAYFGMRGRVTSLQFAVTVVGFTTVRTMATVALTELDYESRLPEDFWDVTTCLALASSTLAPRFGERSQDALCVGLLAQMGAALLHHDDPEGYGALVAEHPGFPERRAAELRRYGINSVRLTAVALEQWGFPHTMTHRLNQVDDATSVEGGLLRAAFEVAARITEDDHEAVPITRLTCGQLREDDLVPVLDQVRADAAELRRAMLGD
ncbi:HDOD domain-containing protein [Blastococcus sp. MG754426]|uniref:HDOD domain-containing protein n=1 Tax=unclassified Blastococcus TaxID=2619396 RepID=UPI001EF09CE1|nr:MULTISPECIES: HDOD domain-containing protein [unclassified Blastococcus]MCF6508967.1 HDOD domain-containing protein [Blastococcus sp. MG754426]MCF6513664.1 HDOD domain-containing protein [Blastococcus sp. MG754427]